MTKITDPKTRLFMEFFEKEMGVKFVDADTGEKVTVLEDGPHDKQRSQTNPRQ